MTSCLVAVLNLKRLEHCDNANMRRTAAYLPANGSSSANPRCLHKMKSIMSTRRDSQVPSRPRFSKTIKGIPWTPEENDIIIPVMGPTGAGKSTFINCIAGKAATKVGHDLKSCTAELLPVVIDSSQMASLNDKRLVLMDTPGFGDTYVDDADILRRIGYWLETMYHEKETKLAGVIYLHDISLTRMLGTTRKNLEIFQKLCGDGALRNVVLCTTKWSDTYEVEGEKRSQQLCEAYWKEMIDHGSNVRKFGDSWESAWEVVDLIIEANREKMEALQIQEELVDARKLIPDTEAGRQLAYSLDQLLKSLKQTSKGDPSRRKELEPKIAVIRHQIKEMRIPVSVRVLGVLDLGYDKMLNIFTLTNRISWSAPGVKKLLENPLDKSTLTNHAHPSTAPPVGARLGADVNNLILLLGETGAVNAKVLKHLAAKHTDFGNDEVHCWSVERGDRSQLVVEAPAFDSPGGVPGIFQNIRTWLSNSCRADMQFGIVHLQNSLGSAGSPSVTSHATRAVELVKQSTLASNTVLATFNSGEQTTEETGEATSQFEYALDGSAWVKCDASKLLDIALEKLVGLDLFLSGLHAIVENANAEVLILVMGGVGCGKSTFINSAAGETVIKVNNDMTSSSTIQEARCSHPTFKKPFILVEIPGFDNMDRKSDSAILVDTAKWMKKRCNDVKFGGILYLQQTGRAQPMLKNLLGNELIKQSLFHVVTALELSGGSGASKQGDAKFPNVRQIAYSERKTFAWEIINQVLGKVEPKQLTVGVFQTELREITGTTDEGKKEGSRRWFGLRR